MPGAQHRGLNLAPALAGDKTFKDTPLMVEGGHLFGAIFAPGGDEIVKDFSGHRQRIADMKAARVKYRFCDLGAKFRDHLARLAAGQHLIFDIVLVQEGKFDAFAGEARLALEDKHRPVPAHHRGQALFPDQLVPGGQRPLLQRRQGCRAFGHLLGAGGRQELQKPGDQRKDLAPADGQRGQRVGQHFQDLREADAV